MIFLINSVFSFREEMAGKRNFEYLPRENLFFKVRACAGAAGKVKKPHTKIIGKTASKNEYTSANF